MSGMHEVSYNGILCTHLSDFLPVYPSPIKGPVPNANKYVLSPILMKKKSQSEKEISQIGKCILIHIA